MIAGFSSYSYRLAVLAAALSAPASLLCAQGARPAPNAPAPVAAAAGSEASTVSHPAAAETGRANAQGLGSTRSVPDDYVIGAGDTLGVFVWKEPDASVPSVVVRPDGKIALPLLKEIQVAGLTPAQAEKAITQGLSKLIVTGVDVTVVVTAINSKKIYIMGAVKKEGTIPYTYRMTVMQAIGEAGGLNDFAKRKKIYVLRNVAGASTRLPFNYDEVIRGARPEQNVELLPGDMLVIPH
jgi:polysaccharide biosynthesis/export protein